jgi:hypothetical protein
VPGVPGETGRVSSQGIEESEPRDVGASRVKRSDDGSSKPGIKEKLKVSLSLHVAPLHCLDQAVVESICITFRVGFIDVVSLNP